ncbi:MAG: hypothetical protein JWR75_547 [Devosia sp.]|nr:hypothetical protein [Devosia sp.]
MSGRAAVRSLRESGAFAPSSRNSEALTLVMIVFATFALGCGAFFGVSWMIKAAGPSTQKMAPLVMVADLSRIWTPKDTASCEVYANANNDRDEELRAGAAVLLGNQIASGAFAREARRLNCYASTKIARLCDGEERKIFVSLVDRYVTRLDLMAVAMNLTSDQMSLLAGVGIGGQEAKLGTALYDMGLSATVDYVKFYHADITASLRKLATKGLLSSNDFGVILGLGASPTIKHILDNITPVETVCS